MNDDILIPSPESQTSADIEASSEGGDVSRGDQVFDISEDNISPIKEEAEPLPGQTFQLKKVLPKLPTTPKTPASTQIRPEQKTPSESNTPLPGAVEVHTKPSIPPKTPTEPNTTPESPTKNVLDPNYVAPGVFSSRSTVTAKPTPKIKLPPLPEIPAFKGTFDTKPHTFTPSTPKSTTPSTLQENFPNTTQIEGGMSGTTPSSAAFSNKSTIPSTSPISPTQTNSTIPQSQSGPTLAKPINPTIPGQAKPFVSAFSTPTTTPQTPTNPTPSGIQPTIQQDSSIPQKNPILATSSPSSTFVKGQSPANPPTKTLGSRPTQPQPGKIQAPEKTELKNLRTYESDVAAILANKQVSKASIAIAANTKKEAVTEAEVPPETSVPTTSHNTLKFILILLSAFFIGAGLFGAYYLYSKSVFVPLERPTTQQPESSTITSSNIVPVDTQTKIDIQGLSAAAITQKIRAEIDKPRNPNTIHELVLTNGNVQISGPEMISRMNIDMPDILARSFTPLWTLGVYTDETGNKDVFVMGTTNFFQNTFVGMLQWEKLMVDDLKIYLPISARSTIPSPTDAPIGTSTIATSTPTEPTETPYYFTIRGSFENRITKNKDVRIFKTTTGETLFLYSFVNAQTLLVTGRENTLVEILNRLENQAFVR